ncbi:MAG: helix-turn-helix transcriptional regulator [Chloroflexi bacterium]|nr:helix-turn-helix transcriptional regulator [Chloroflexota bacterium]
MVTEERRERSLHGAVLLVERSGVMENGIVMSYQGTFKHLLAALHDATLDDARWPAASALIDEACGIRGNGRVVGEGSKDDIQARFIGFYHRGQRREDLEREYLEDYHPTDERVPRFRQLPDGRLAHVTDLYTAEELKTSPTYNEMLRRIDQQDSVNVRLEEPDGAHIGWGLGDPADSDGWGSSRIAMVTALLPHVRQFVRVRQALVRAEARNTTVTALLGNPRIGVLHLDRRGRIMAANDRARSILRRGDGLSDRKGMLHARAPTEQVRLERLLGAALPASDTASVSGSMLLRRSPVLPPFVVHVKPVGVPQPDYGARPVAALVLIVEPERSRRVDPDLVARTLELTPAEAQVAVWLAEGKSVREMAEATGRTKSAIYWHLQQIYQKQSISRQADLVRLVLSLAEFG